MDESLIATTLNRDLLAQGVAAGARQLRVGQAVVAHRIAVGQPGPGTRRWAQRNDGSKEEFSETLPD